MKRLLRGSYFYIILLVLLIAFVVYQGRNIPKVEEKRLDQFVADIQERKIEKLTLRGPYVDGVLKGSKTEFSVYLPEEMRVTFYPDYLKELVENKEIKLGAEPPPQRPWYMDIIPYLITFVLLGGIWFVFMNRSQGGNAGVMNFGKSKARLNREDGPRITFNDVAGLKEEKKNFMKSSIS